VDKKRHTSAMRTLMQCIVTSRSSPKLGGSRGAPVIKGRSDWFAQCSPGPEEIWRGYNRRADTENRIVELKHDLGADGFCMKQFFAH
jgi:hypothetical protein